MLLHGSQTAVATYRYDPFGRTLTSSGSLAMANTLRFSSKPVHHASGLYDYGYRWYSPDIQRWISRDPLGERGGLNPYAFVENNPINATDLFGLYTGNVKNCEVVVLFGHGSGRSPHTFTCGGSCSAGHFVGCYSKATNNKVRRQPRIPGTPSTDDELYGGPGNRDRPGQSRDNFMDDSWEAAKKKAQAICESKDNCCKSVTVSTELAGFKFHPDRCGFPGTRQETIKCDGK